MLQTNREELGVPGRSLLRARAPADRPGGRRNHECSVAESLTRSSGRQSTDEHL